MELVLNMEQSADLWGRLNRLVNGSGLSLEQAVLQAVEDRLTMLEANELLSA